MSSINKKVFYSWQSDIGKKTNRSVIEKAITTAVKKLNASDKNEYQYSLDKDTLNVPGSPDIVETIIKKIKQCELFVSDITPILSTSKGKAMPNSNVFFETGYSVGKKGFERTLLILNETYGSVEDLPFDIKTKRITKYKLSESDLSEPENKLNVIKALSSAIAKSLELVADLPPIKLDNSKESDTKIMRERDLDKLKRFLENLPISIVQKHVTLGNESLAMNFNIFTVLYNLQAVQHFSGFKLYDKKLNQKINKFINYLDRSLSFGHSFYYNSGNIYRFQASDGVPQKKYLSVLNKVQEALDKLITYIHEEYVEIDIDEYNTKAFNSYIEEIKKEEED